MLEPVYGWALLYFEERKMSPQEFYDRMAQINEDYKGDPEALHAEMDRLMCHVLSSLGYAAGVNVFENATILYA